MELIRAAAVGDINSMRTLLTFGRSLTATDSGGRTALHMAAWNGHVVCLKVLLEAGADVDAKETQWGDTPLMKAAQNGQLEALIALLKAGADVAATCHWQRTALHEAVLGGHSECVVQLVTHSFRQCLEGGAGPIAWDDAVWCMKDQNGQTALHKAAVKGNLECVRLLGKLPNAVGVGDTRGRTALHLAARNGYSEVVSLLLGLGSDANAVDSEWGDTPLHKAAACGRLGSIEVLLNVGADPFLTDKYGRIALHDAADGGHAEAVLKLAAAAGSSLEAKQQHGCTPLHFAAKKGHASCVRALLMLRASVHAVDSSGQTALHVAAMHGHAVCIRALLTAGAAIDAKDTTWGDTPLHKAARGGRLDCVRLLLEKGADAEETNNRGKNPVQVAAEEDHINVAAALLQAMDNLHLSDSEGAATGSSASSRSAPSGDSPVCEICYSEPVEMSLIPCGHTKYCSTCCSAMMRRDKKCPHCRTQIEGTLRVYL